MQSSHVKYLFLICFTLLTNIKAETSAQFTFRSGLESEYQIPEAFINAHTTQQPHKNLDLTATRAAEISVPNTTIKIKRFARDKKTVIVLGQGFTDSQEIWKKKAIQFDDYDVVTFDYTWWTRTAFIHPLKSLLNDRYADVIAVVNYLRKNYNYEKIVGLGICYSAFTFAAAQAHAIKNNTPLFDKLILDSMFDSLLTLNLSIALDPTLSCNNDTGLLPNWFKWMLKKLRATSLLTMSVPNVSIVPYLNHIANKTPILFIHGTNDLLEPLEAFNTMWNDTKTIRSMALITPFSHVTNMKKNWGVYKTICDCFINSNIGTENTALQNLFFPTN